MSALTEFLQHAGKQWLDAAPQREAALADWRGAVERLLDQIQQWVRASDPDGVLQIESMTVERIEPRLGRYTLPAITLRLGPRWVHIVPVARYTPLVSVALAPGATERPTAGCVAISDSTSPVAPYANYRLYRLDEPAADRWFVSAGGPPDLELTREVFERVLVGLLK